MKNLIITCFIAFGLAGLPGLAMADHLAKKPHHAKHHHHCCKCNKR